MQRTENERDEKEFINCVRSLRFQKTIKENDISDHFSLITVNPVRKRSETNAL